MAAAAAAAAHEAYDGHGAGVQLSGHFIVCGHGGSVVSFMEYLRTAEPSRTVPIVVLAPTHPADWEAAC